MGLLLVAPSSLRHQSTAARIFGTSKKTIRASSMEAKPDVLIQYIVVRKDLLEGLAWPLGSVITQACHAAVAATWLHKDDEDTARYCSQENIDKMHKVTLEVKGEPQLVQLAKKLEDAAVVHKLWVEQPENIPTCLATKPYWKSKVEQHFKKLKLCK